VGVWRKRRNVRGEILVFPIYDEKKPKGQGFRPWTNWTLIACNIFVFLYLQMFPSSAVFRLFLEFGAVPAKVAHIEHVFQLTPPELTLVSYMFLHISWWHLLINMLFLWVFGDDVEEATGHLRFILLYLLAGIAAGLVHTFGDPQSMTPLIGASGAIAGVVGAYVLLLPRAKIVVLLFGIVPIRLLAIWVVSIWLALQVLPILVPQMQGGISYWGHIGGFVMGSLALLVLRRSNVSLLGPRHGNT
jgi:membrane associated rhomboid family serine protease